VGGAITPTPNWLLYADPEVAAITPNMVWLHIADP